MEKIPTAEEFLANLPICYEGDTGQSYEAYFAMHIPEKLKVFAKLHVKAALEAASKTHAIHNGWDWVADKKAITQSYPEDNIK